MFAAVDLGSNSFRMHIAAYDGRNMRIMRSAREPVRLGAGMDAKGNLTEKAMRTAVLALEGFREILYGYALDCVKIVATNTLRIANNAQTFLPRAEKAIGYPIEIISGEEEGRLIYLGVAYTAAASAERRLVIDIGGGSTEVILGEGKAIENVESFSIGTVGHGQNFFPDGHIDAASFESAILSARSYFEDGALQFRPRNWSNVYGSSGTIRAIAEMISKNSIGDGPLSRSALKALKQRLIDREHMDRVDFAGARSDRIPAIVGGLAILIALMKEFGIERILPVESGLRMGVLWDLQLRAAQRDRREQSVFEFLRLFRVNERRAHRVADMACAFYSQLNPGSGAYERYLYWSGLLHEVGLIVSHTGFHKHGAYLIANADLPGHTARDQRTMSMLILAQKGNLRKVADTLADPDFAKAVLALRLAAMFMHSRAKVSAEDIRLRMKGRIELEVPDQWMEFHPSASYWLDKERALWEEVGIDFIARARK